MCRRHAIRELAAAGLIAALGAHPLRAAGSHPIPRGDDSDGLGVESEAGRFIRRFVGSDFSRLHPYGIGVESGKFVRLDLQTFEVVRPVQYATGREVYEIADRLASLNRRMADGISEELARMGVALQDPIEMKWMLETRPEVLGRLMGRELDAGTLHQINNSLEQARAPVGGRDPWHWLFEAAGSASPLRDAVAAGPGDTPIRREPAYRLPLADQYLARQDDDSRVAGVRLLGLSGFPALARLSRIASEDASLEVRADAVEQLGSLGGPAAMDALWRLYQQGDSEPVKAEILYAMLRGRDHRAVDAALEVMRTAPSESRLLQPALVILGANFSLSRRDERPLSFLYGFYRWGIERPSQSLHDLRLERRQESGFSFHPRTAEVFQAVGARLKRASLDAEPSDSPAGPSSRERLHLLFGEMIQQSYLMKSADPAAQREFFASVRDPEALYAAFALMRLPDSSIGDGLFQSLQSVLEGKGQSLSDWVREQDPEGVSGRGLFLQLSEMGFLAPAIRKDTRLAGDIAGRLFSPRRDPDGGRERRDPDGGRDPIRTGVFIDAALKSWPAQARQEFIRGAAREAQAAEGDRQKQLGLLLASMGEFYGSTLTAEEKGLIRQAVPAARFELRNPISLDGRATQSLRGVVAFDDFGQYRDFLKVAQARGYQVSATGKHPRLRKGPIEFELVVEPLEIKQGAGRILARLTRQGETNLAEGERQRKEMEWEAEIGRKLSGAQFLAMRGEPWFMDRAPRLLSRSQSKESMLVFLGACYSVDQVYDIQEACSRCATIANSGTGRYLINNEVLFTTLDAAAQGANDWSQVGQGLAKVLSKKQHPEVVGPWHFGAFYRDQLHRLESQRPSGRAPLFIRE